MKFHVGISSEAVLGSVARRLLLLGAEGASYQDAAPGQLSALEEVAGGGLLQQIWL